MACSDHAGVLHTGTAQAKGTLLRFKRPCTAAIARPTSSTPGTAQRGHQRRPTTKAKVMPKTKPGACGAALTASRPKRASTPANSAAAMAWGMRSITRSNQRVTPATTMSKPQTTKAPVASAKLRPLLAAIKAAPGVDHAVSTGWRAHSERPIDVAAMPKPSAQIHDAICCGLAPRFCAGRKNQRNRAGEAHQHRNKSPPPAVQASSLWPDGLAEARAQVLAGPWLAVQPRRDSRCVTQTVAPTIRKPPIKVLLLGASLKSSQPKAADQIRSKNLTDCVAEMSARLKLCVSM